MKKIFNAFFIVLTIALIWTFVLYLFFSLGTWDLNPAHWSNPIRCTFAIFSGILGIGIGLGVYTNKDYK